MTRISVDQVYTASTGMIGVRLAASKVTGVAPTLVSSLTAAPEPAAEAILTTDTRTKLASRSLVCRIWSRSDFSCGVSPAGTVLTSEPLLAQSPKVP